MNTQTGIALLGSAVVWLLLERRKDSRRLSARVLRPGVRIDLTFVVLGYLLLTLPTLYYVRVATEGFNAAFGSRLQSVALPLSIRVLVAVVLLDLGGYFVHRLLHRVGPLWEFHKVHHSSPMLDWLATFRSHLVEQVFRRAFTPLLLFALGMSMDAIVLGSAVIVGWAMFGHANIGWSLRPLEWVLIPPRLHHLHHVPATSQKNFAVVFSCWDRWMGTLATQTAPADCVLGVPDEVTTYPTRFFDLLREPFSRLVSRNERSP